MRRFVDIKSDGSNQSGNPAAVSSEFHGALKKNVFSLKFFGFRPVVLRPNLSSGLPLSNLLCCIGQI